MKWFSRLIVYGFLALVSGAVLFFFASSRIINVPSVKAELEKRLSRSIHRTVAIDGDLELAFFPWTIFKIPRLTVANTPGFKSPFLFECNGGEIWVAPLKLLQKQFRIQKIVLDKPSLHLEIQPDGQFNWANPAKAPSDFNEKKTFASLLDGLPLDLETIHIRSGAIDLDDRQREIAWAGLNIYFYRAGSLRRDFRLELTSTLSGRLSRGLRQIKTDLNVQGRSILNPSESTLILEDVSLNINGAVEDAVGRNTPVGLKGDLRLDLVRGELDTEKITGTFGKLLLEGDLNIRNLYASPEINGHCRMPALAAADLWDGGFAFQTDRRQDRAPTVGFTTDFQYQEHRLNLRNMDIIAGQNAFDGDGDINFREPAVSLALHTDHLRMEQLPSTDSNSSTPDVFLEYSFGKQIESIERINVPFKVNAALIADRASIGGIRFQEVRINLNLRDKTLDIPTIAFRSFDGSVSSAAAFSLSNGELHGRMNGEVKGLRMEAILPRLKTQPVLRRGIASGKFEIAARGRTVAGLLKTMEADIDAAMRDGEIRLAPKTANTGSGIPERIAIGKATAHLIIRPDSADPARAPGQKIRCRFSFENALNTLSPNIRGGIHLQGWIGVSPEFDQYTMEDADLTLHLDGGDLLPKGSTFTLNSRLAVDTRNESLNLADIRLDGMGLRSQGNLTVKNMFSQAAITGDFNLNDFNPRKLLENLGHAPLDLNDPTAFHHLSISSRVKIDASATRFDEMEIRMDDSLLHGAIDMTNNHDARYSFDFAGDQIDLDRYLPSPKDQGPEPPPTGGKAEQPSAAIEEAGKEKGRINLNGNLAMQVLKIGNLRFSDLDINYFMDGNVIEIHPLSARFYNGLLNLRLKIDLALPEPQSTLALSAVEMELGDMHTDFTGKPRVTGKTRMNVNLSAAGADWPSIRANLNGDATVSIQNGAFHGIRIIPRIVQKKRESRRIDSGTSGPDAFDALTGSLQVVNGRISGQDLHLVAGLLKADGHGTVDLVKKYVDCAAEAYFPGVPIVTYNVRGPFRGITVTLDKTNLARDTARGILKTPLNVANGTADLGDFMLDVGTDILTSGDKALGNRNTTGRAVGRSVLGVGKGILNVGRGILGAGRKVMDMGTLILDSAGKTDGEVDNAKKTQ